MVRWIEDLRSGWSKTRGRILEVGDWWTFTNGSYSFLHIAMVPPKAFVVTRGRSGSERSLELRKWQYFAEKTSVIRLRSH